ncbi:hypothetical protein [Methylobacterium thuringiense]|uniref:Uncharacterized protein n=1 Tax=Methylobacterium thuringiense TaxID=1003091 RepID=A0ABQ4TIB8_9HYPH|nr:hypothetical protein [Methylobacterium thuringiense]GJE54537.1 hypothetical protein EKPJFOCH_1015 [Methylobacterium thuringiense]
MEQALVTIPAQTALQAFTTDRAIDPFLAKVREQIDGFTADVSTPKGRKEIASFAFRIAQTKARLEDVGKALADEQKAIPKKIDASRKLVRDTLDGWRDEVRAPLTRWEEAEAARVAGHRASIASVAQAATPHATVALTREAIAEVEAFVIGPACQEFEAEYARTKDETLRSLRAQVVDLERREAEQVELVRLRAEADAQAASERDERIRAEAAEAERTKAARAAEEERLRVEREAEAERARVEAAAKAERDAAERRERALQQEAEDARRRAAEAERQAAETERRLRDEAEAKARQEAAAAAAREANKRRCARINNEAVAALVAGGVDPENARAAIVLIARRAVPLVTIQY